MQLLRWGIPQAIRWAVQKWLSLSSFLHLFLHFLLVSPPPKGTKKGHPLRPLEKPWLAGGSVGSKNITKLPNFPRLAFEVHRRKWDARPWIGIIVNYYSIGMTWGTRRVTLKKVSTKKNKNAYIIGNINIHRRILRVYYFMEFYIHLSLIWVHTQQNSRSPTCLYPWPFISKPLMSSSQAPQAHFDGTSQKYSTPRHLNY